MTLDHQEDDETVPPSQCQYSAIEALSRLRGLLPAVFAKPAAISTEEPHPLPTTTTERRRASIVADSIDQDEHLSEKIADQLPQTVAAEETVLYLAYGSNMAEKTFRGMRGIKPLSNINVLVPELRLTFDLPGVPYIEPCFAGTQFRDPDAPSEQNTECDEEEEDGVLVEDSDYMSEKAPLMAESQRSDEKSGYHKTRWHKPLVGVVYEVTVTDFAKIIATEGGGRGYRDVVVDCYPFAEDYKPTDPVPEHPGTGAFKVHTLLSPAADEARKRRQKGDNAVPAEPDTPTPSAFWPLRNEPHLRPDPNYAQSSARYLKLLTTGAAENNLPIAYQEYLAQIRPYRITTTCQKIGKFIFLGLWGPWVLAILSLSKAFAGPDGRSPPWLAALANTLFDLVWKSYDGFFVKAFGDGERSLDDTPLL